jgi:hypothetical protein
MEDGHDALVRRLQGLSLREPVAQLGHPPPLGAQCRQGRDPLARRPFRFGEETHFKVESVHQVFP